MAKYSIEESTLTAIAEAIRAKTESSDPIDAADMAALIEGIEAGGATINSGTLYIAESVTVTTSEPFSVEHGLGVAPDFVIFAKATKCTVDSQFRAAFYVKKASLGDQISYSLSAKSGGIATLPSSYTSESSSVGVSVDDAEFHVYASDKKISAYNSYYWIAGVI